MIRLGLVAPQPAQQANPAEQGDVPMHGADAGQGGGDGMNLDDVAIDRNLPDSPARSNGGDPPNDPVGPPPPTSRRPPPSTLSSLPSTLSSPLSSPPSSPPSSPLWTSSG